MLNDRKNDLFGGGRSDGNGSDDSSAETSEVGSSENLSVSLDNYRSEGEEVGLTERLTDLLVDEGDSDLMMQGNNGEIFGLQWLQALDMQVMGACRADERLKPLLKLSVSSGVAEDGVLAHLSQHFEPSEIGNLARCLCVPLVSIRVGKNIKEGTRLCPTAIRGSLNLMLLPTSDLRITFIGDDGHTDRLCTLSSNSQCSTAVVKEIPVDNTGRSFLVEISDHQVFYFWCSEKSMLLGTELLAKMKDLLTRKPSIADLTGISELRLECFAAHLRAYLVDSAVNESRRISASSPSSSTQDFSQVTQNNTLSLFPCTKPTRFKLNGLSPRPSSFKEGLPKTLTTLRTAVKERLKRRVDNLTLLDDLPIASSTSTTQALSPLSFLESLGKSAAAVTAISPASLVSPYYCWLPPCVSSKVSLPPLSSFLPSTTPLNATSSLGLPSFLPTFTPLMCDPIVHIPVISVCSSGQGYLVSASNNVNPLRPDSDSVLENGARETLRRLINGTNDENRNMIRRGLYSGTSDVEAITNGIAALKLGRCNDRDDLDDQVIMSSGMDGFGSGAVSDSSNLEEKSID